jgi:peptidoglycan/LPS O-acetylase OafA/YrhL
VKALPQKALILNSRNRSLDVLRGVAILLVLGRHASYIEHSRYLNFWFRIGWSGVDLFFVLSGFLISGLLFSEFKLSRAIKLKRFWIRRAFKIYPPFYMLIAFVTALSIFRIGRVPHALLADVLFVNNYFPHILDHGWSLAVEEHFYLMLPVFLAGLVFAFPTSTDPFRAVPLTSLALSVLCLAMRMKTAVSGVGWEQLSYPTHLRIDSLFLGVALGYYAHFRSLKVHRPWLCLLVGTLLLLPGFALGTTLFTATVGLLMMPLGYGCILVWALHHEPSRSLRPLVWLGRYSYSIYLWHVIVAMLCNEILPQTSLARFSLQLATSIVVGVVMAKLIEIPSLKIRDRLFPALNHRAERRAIETLGGNQPQPLAAAD